MLCQYCGVRYKKDPIFEECPACGCDPRIQDKRLMMTDRQAAFAWMQQAQGLRANEFGSLSTLGSLSSPFGMQQQYRCPCCGRR